MEDVVRAITGALTRRGGRMSVATGGGAEEETVRRAPWWQRFVTGFSTHIGLILVGLILVFSFLEYDSFVSASNARNIFTDAVGAARARRRE